MKKTAPISTPDPSQLITSRIAELGGWRGSLLARLRELILEAAPGTAEEWKWDTAVWSNNGLICSAGAFKEHMKLNFFKGASLKDPKGLFNAGLEANTSRAIDFIEGEEINETALKALIRAAVSYNQSAAAKK